MRETALDIGVFNYDSTRALFDGAVGFSGLNVTLHTGATLPEIFAKTLRGNEYDIGELGLTFHLRGLAAGSDLVALPVFTARVFRHSCVWVNADSGITGPKDLVDRTIGEFGVYGQDSGVWAKGVLMDEYGFEPARNRWVIGGLDRPAAPFEFTGHPHPADVEVTATPEGRSLGEMLAAGEIDALFTANIPQVVLDGATNIRPLFPDAEDVERDYYRRTGIFPIMHTVVAPRGLLAAHPGLARTVYNGFLAAKEFTADRYRAARRLYGVTILMPWMRGLLERDQELLGADWWPYGIEANRTTLETFLRYHHEQGLSSTRPTIEEVFAEELLDT
ncbi:MAG TPA: 4,5-dihydroxyphthalate decarboxylase [Pseudonocardiaceae bacterium]|jgi:4,5-dihydroxyphthalate decarboxylase|nr:4,5-dihydroxyphthalate decarboxylase [Pseudonocardiaceae bacterium]